MKRNVLLLSVECIPARSKNRNSNSNSNQVLVGSALTCWNIYHSLEAQGGHHPRKLEKK